MPPSGGSSAASGRAALDDLLQLRGRTTSAAAVPDHDPTAELRRPGGTPELDARCAAVAWPTWPSMARRPARRARPAPGAGLGRPAWSGCSIVRAGRSGRNARATLLRRRGAALDERPVRDRVLSSRRSGAARRPGRPGPGRAPVLAGARGRPPQRDRRGGPRARGARARRRPRAYALAVQALAIDPEDALALRLEARLAEVMAARGEPPRPAFVVAASEAALARTRARLEAADGALAEPAPGPDTTGLRGPTCRGRPTTGTPPPPGRRRGLFRRFDRLMHVLVTGGAGYVGASPWSGSWTPATRSPSWTRWSRATPWPCRRGCRAGGRQRRAIRRRSWPSCRARHRRRAPLRRPLPGRQSMRDPALYYHENVVGGIALLEAMREAGLRRSGLQLDGRRLRAARGDPRGRGRVSCGR